MAGLQLTLTSQLRAVQAPGEALLTGAGRNVETVQATLEDPSPVFSLLAEHCTSCHDAVGQEGNLDLERFATWDDALADRATWQRVYQMVDARQMPPRDAGDSLAEVDRQLILSWIMRLQAAPEPRLGGRDPGKPVLRRMTRLEYNNTVRDLLGLQTDVFLFSERLPVADKGYFHPESRKLPDRLETSMREYGGKARVLLPQLGLPGDNRAEHGYANRGDALNLSPLLLEKYLALATEIAASPELPEVSPAFARLAGIAPRPSSTPSGDSDRLTARAVDALAPHENVKRHAEGNDAWLSAFRDVVAEAHAEGRGGVYDVARHQANTTLVAGKQRLQVEFGADRALLIQPDANLWLVSFATAQESSGDLLLANKQKGGKTYRLKFTLRDAAPSEGIVQLGLCILGRQGQQGDVELRARLANGQEIARSARIQEDAGQGNTFFSFVAPPGTHFTELLVAGQNFSGDYVLLDDLAFVTNLPPQSNLELEATPVSSSSTASPSLPHAPAKSTRERIAEFLLAAFRRPPTTDELDQYHAMYTAARQKTDDEAQALRPVLAAVLASPNFLFLAEPQKPEAAAIRPLNSFELASRLSYFLWSSKPDDSLLSLAAQSYLNEPQVLQKETLRLLRDVKSRELSESFAVQWLRLDQLYTAKPDRKLFREFYSGPQGKNTLHASMLIEALLLFETIMIEDRSVLELLDTDYSWLNARLMKHYGLDDHYHEVLAELAHSRDESDSGPSQRELKIDPKDANSVWFRCKLPNRSRGGIMTMAGPLTVTSLPYRTSPVKRGGWLLETVFNRPPAEPKVAFVLEEPKSSENDLTSATVRQRFEQHRNQAACFACHSRIDPPGFALEVFDPVGALRQTENGQPLDATGQWNGRDFDGPAEFKAAVLVRQEEFVRGFIEHLLSYALGRKLEPFDMPVVEQIQLDAARDGYRFSSIVSGITASYPFRHVRNVDLEAVQP